MAFTGFVASTRYIEPIKATLSTTATNVPSRLDFAAANVIELKGSSTCAELKVRVCRNDAENASLAFKALCRSQFGRLSFEYVMDSTFVRIESKGKRRTRSNDCHSSL